MLFYVFVSIFFVIYNIRSTKNTNEYCKNLKNCRDNFDVERLKEAASMFAGRHDFRTFMSVNNDVQVSNLSS